MNIFVFGSNLAGIHGAGSARAAVEKYGAIYGQGIGLQGNSYAIPTKDENIESMPLGEIERHVRHFVQFASEHLEMKFDVVKIGCGLAGFKDEQIAPMFFGVTTNVVLPEGWSNLANVHRMDTTAVENTLKEANSTEEQNDDGKTNP